MKTPNTHIQTAFRLLVASILATTLFAVTPIATAKEPKKAIRRTEEKNIKELKAKIDQTKIQIKELDLQIAKQENLKRSIPKSATTKSGYASEEGAQRAKQLEANIAACKRSKKIMKANYDGGQAAIQALKAN
jgi:hypothetical protein